MQAPNCNMPSEVKPVKSEENAVESIDIVDCKEEETSDRTISLLGAITATETDIKKPRKKKKTQSEKLQEMLKQEEVCIRLICISDVILFRIKSNIFISFQINRYRNQNSIRVVGRNVPPPARSFEELQASYKVDPLLIDNLKSCGYIQPTAVQKQAMTAMLLVCIIYLLKFGPTNIT